MLIDEAREEMTQAIKAYGRAAADLHDAWVYHVGWLGSAIDTLIAAVREDERAKAEARVAMAINWRARWSELAKAITGKSTSHDIHQAFAAQTAVRHRERVAELEAEIWALHTNEGMVCEQEPCGDCCGCTTADAYGCAVSVADYERRNEIEARVNAALRGDAP